MWTDILLRGKKRDVDQNTDDDPKYMLDKCIKFFSGRTCEELL